MDLKIDESRDYIITLLSSSKGMSQLTPISNSKSKMVMLKLVSLLDELMQNGFFFKTFIFEKVKYLISKNKKNLKKMSVLDSSKEVFYIVLINFWNSIITKLLKKLD